MSTRSRRTCAGSGSTWDGMFYASDYFPQLFAWAEPADPEAGLAYVDDQTAEQIANNRGTVRSAGHQQPVP